MKRMVVIVAVGCLWNSSALQAQELSVRPFVPPVNGSAGLQLPPSNLHQTPLWRPETKIGTFQQPSVLQRQNRKVQRRRERELNQEADLWRMTIGNTSANNWSPYPDRALDARTLRFPLPRKPEAQHTRQPQPRK